MSEKPTPHEHGSDRDSMLLHVSLYERFFPDGKETHESRVWLLNEDTKAEVPETEEERRSLLLHLHHRQMQWGGFLPIASYTDLQDIDKEKLQAWAQALSYEQLAEEIESRVRQLKQDLKDEVDEWHTQRGETGYHIR
jgi:hypothetical protein